MKLLLLVLVLGVAMADPAPANGKSGVMPIFEVNLDAEPQERWNAVVDHFRPGLISVLDAVEHALPVSNATAALVEKVLGDIVGRFGAEYAAEMTGIAQRLNRTTGEIVVANLFYELTAACTSIVAYSQANATIGDQVLHGRNLDYGIPGLNRIALQANFVKNGQVVYRGVTYAGYIGLLTGMRPGAFSVSLDERYTKNGTILTNVLEALLDGGKSVGMFLRSTLETKSSFSDALTAVQTQHLITVSYIIMGGVTSSEGAVVTRDRNDAYDTWMFDYPSRWYLTETNYFHGSPPPSGDNRRDPANARMNATTPASITAGYLFKDVILQFPNLNSETTYSCIMSAVADQIHCITQNL